MEKEWLFGKTLGELAEVAASFGMPRFTATQIAAWIYRKGALSIDEMTNISLKNRRALEERYQVGRIPSAAVQQSADGTKKYLFPTLRIASSNRPTSRTASGRRCAFRRSRAAGWAAASA